MIRHMRILLQKVSRAAVSIEREVVGQIDEGFVLFVGIMQGDTEEEAIWLANKVLGLRLFDGDKINDRSIQDISGGILVISQFTLAASVQKGNRPDYTAAASPLEAEKLYDFLVQKLRAYDSMRVSTGRFGAHMLVELTNNGPVTIMLERSPSPVL
ncbi:MAG: D-tyrosyl-tRNA(Tyr) deacylase [Candidatus Peribacteria bacterium]|nr:D-tyrosyl-tRNA(Tyr) deacylase [Candidatus Peribacteria bacterium]